MKNAVVWVGMGLAVMGLACKPRSFNEGGTVKSAGVSATWFNNSYTHENGGIFLTLKYSGESSIQFAGRSPWGFVGQLHLDGTAKMSGVLREKAVEGNIPCWEFHVSSWNDGQAYSNGMVKVTMEWAQNITESMKRVCAQKSDFAFARDVVPGMYKLDKAPVSTWFKKSYMHESGGIFLKLDYGSKSSISSTGRSQWGFEGDLVLDGTAKMSGALREKAVEGNIPCWEFHVSSWNDGQAYPNGMVKVSMEWPQNITESMKRVCAQKSDFTYVRDIVPGMYKVSE